MTACQKEILERRICGKTISVIRITPELQPDERNAAKKAVEQRLYGVFSKYIPEKPNDRG
ncbi:MAG: hypothetical protein ACI4GO_06805 [Hominenteromicrobium sp.]